MCDCVDVKMGSYNNQIILPQPSWSSKENGICVDKCIAKEVYSLWRAGIITTGCCCGHNKKNGYIGVFEGHISQMESMGYIHAPNSCRPDAKDGFYPKSVGWVDLNLENT